MDKTIAGKLNIRLQYLLSFVLPVMIMGLAFFTLGVYPGGKNTLLTSDLKALYLALYGYLSDPGPGFNNLFHCMSGGLGGNIYGTVILCVSPFDFIYGFIPVSCIPSALYLLILFRIGLCGLSFSYFLSRNERFYVRGVMAVLFSCCYALMSYNIMHYLVPMWYDCVILLPLLALALEKVITGGKSPAFIVLMAICLIDDYYIAYMVVIALILYFLFRSVDEWSGFREFVKRSERFALHGVISTGIAAFVVIPAIYDLARGKAAEGDFLKNGVLIKNSFADILRSLLFRQYAGIDFNASPNIYCGIICIILALVWFVYGRKNVRGRIAGLLVTVFYFTSFIWGPLDRAWHGFRDPVCFSVRYAFTFSFFMILFAVRGYSCICEKEFRIREVHGKAIAAVICVLTAIELYSNTGYILSRIENASPFTSYEEYKNVINEYEKLLSYSGIGNDGTCGRIANTVAFTGNDGMLFGYNGFSRFSSSYNLNVSNLLRDIGFNAHNHGIGIKGMTQTALGLFDTGYIISDSEDMADYYEQVYEYEELKLFRNDYSLPFAYAVGCTDVTGGFGPDPFANQNIIFDDFFGSDGNGIVQVYEEVSCTLIEEGSRIGDGVDASETYSFTAERSGHYFLSVEFMNEVVTADEYRDENGNYKPLKIIRDYELDGIRREYGDAQCSLCVDLGYLEEDSAHELILMSSNDEIGASKVYYYNEDAYRDITSRTEGFDIERIDKHGIVLKGNLSEASRVLVTLPGEDGYRVYLDGRKTDYDSYRDTLMIMEAGAGEHEIVIKYTPPGLVTGVLISIVSLAGFGSAYMISKKRKAY